jgi:hypothetical protein
MGTIRMVSVRGGSTHYRALRVVVGVLFLSGFLSLGLSAGISSWMLAGAQTNPGGVNKNQQNNDGKNAASSAAPGTEYSGMYSFLRDGEFVQVTVEDNGRVTGFVSRYGDSETDRDTFLDHFFKAGKLEGDQLTFTTETVHGVAFEFRGTVKRGEGKNPKDEAYYVLKGTLVENTTDSANKTSAASREVALKSFPQDMSSPQDGKK